MRDPFETAKIVEMVRALSLPIWQAALAKGVAADLAHLPEAPDSTCFAENGVDHEEVTALMLARPQDAGAIAGEVIAQLRHRIEVVCSNRRGSVYWRVRPEISVAQAFTNKQYHAGGAHYDAWTDKQFDGDGNWLLISAYARLSRSVPPPPPVPHPVITAIDALNSARRT